jgi:hypothetical protein
MKERERWLEEGKKKRRKGKEKWEDCAFFRY